MLELDSAGHAGNVNAFAPDGLLARKVGSGGWTQYAFDAQGNVAQRLDASGNVLSASAYEAYGQESSTAAQTDPWGFNGRSGYVTDRETGLCYCENRYYDPQGGRWLTRDPMGFDGGINLYGYCGSGPVGNADPEGLKIEIIGNGVDTGRIMASLNKLRSAPKGSPVRNMMDEWDCSPEIIYIAPLPPGVDPIAGSGTDNSLNYNDSKDRGMPTIHYNPHRGGNLPGRGAGRKDLYASPTETLGHELGHRDPKNPRRTKRPDPGGRVDPRTGRQSGQYPGAPVGPDDVVGQIENPLRDWLGHPRRYYY